MKKKYIFLWVNREFKYNRVLGKLEKVEPYFVPALGSFSVCRVDGRLSEDNMHAIAIDFAKKEKAAGYSIGYMAVHDPEDKICQVVSKFKKI
jgi:hypothetical protein